MLGSGIGNICPVISPLLVLTLRINIVYIMHTYRTHVQVSFTLRLDYKMSLQYVVRLFLKPSNVLAFLTLSGSLFQPYTTLLK